MLFLLLIIYVWLGMDQQRLPNGDGMGKLGARGARNGWQFLSEGRDG